MKAVALFAAFLLTTPTLARPAVSFTESGASLTVESPFYRAVLDGDTGGFISVARSGGSDWLARTLHPEGPWVVRLGASEWITPGALKGRGGIQARTITPTPDGVQIVWQSTLADATTSLGATLTMNFADGQFDGRLVLEHRAGAAINLVSYPAYFAFPGPRIERMVFPHRSGIVLLPAFFASAETIGTKSPAGFSPFLWWQTGAGSMAVSNPIEALNRAAGTHVLNLQRDTVGAETLPTLHYDQLTEVAPGARYDSGRILFQVGRDAVASANAHWEAGESRNYRTLADKLGPSLFDKLRQAPLLKYPEATRATDFAATVASLPSPAIIHIAGYMEGGHDERYPDYLPPRASLGTTADLQAMAAAVRAAGSLFVPYTNPTWWDTESPTMTSLGTGIVARRADGSLVQETYGTKAGYVVTPWHPKVRERLEQGYVQFADLGLVDLLFEDQVGARELAFDGNAASPHSWSYAQGTLANTRSGAAHYPLMTEMAWDQLAETEAGFCGNLRLDWEQPALPATHYASYPLAVIMANRNAVFYPHNLDGQRMVHGRTELLYNAALGYQMSYDLNRGISGWLQVAAHVQKRLLLHTVGERIVAFADDRETSSTTRLEYANGASVEANWSATGSRLAGSVVLGPEGFWFRLASPRVEGGWIASYGTDTVGGSDGRLLILERKGDSVEVVSVTDTAFTITVAADWLAVGPGAYEVRRTLADGSTRVAPLIVDAGGARVEYGAGDRGLAISPAGAKGTWSVY